MKILKSIKYALGQLLILSVCVGPLFYALSSTSLVLTILGFIWPLFLIIARIHYIENE